MATDQPSPVLDDVGRAQLVDKRNMLRLINELPEQCETALGLGRRCTAKSMESEPNVVFITGTGDSAVAADMAAVVSNEAAKVPIISDHGCRLPEYIGRDSVVVVVDYSGKSPSALRSCREASKRGAMVIVITSGGSLLEAASKENATVVKIAPGHSARTAIGHLVIPVIAVVEHLGLAAGLTEKLSHAIKLLKSVREGLRIESPSSRNVAKRAAQALLGKVAVIYGGSDYRGAVARRWKSQIQANSKAIALTGVFPDAAENELFAWEQAAKTCGSPAFVMLNDSHDRTETSGLMKASREALAGFEIVDIDLKGSTTVEKLLYGVYLGDYVSYYLALLCGVDPSVTENVEQIAARLAGEAAADG